MMYSTIRCTHSRLFPPRPLCAYARPHLPRQVSVCMVPRRTIIAERVLADAGLFDRVRMEECVPLSSRAVPRSTSQYPIKSQAVP